MRKKLYTLILWLAPFLAAAFYNVPHLLATYHIQRLPPVSEIRYLKGTFFPTDQNMKGRGGYMTTQDWPSGKIYLTCPYYRVQPLPKCKQAIKSLLGEEVEVSYYILTFFEQGKRQLPILLSLKKAGSEVGPLNKEDALLLFHEARFHLILLLSILLVCTGIAYVASLFFKPSSKE